MVVLSKRARDLKGLRAVDKAISGCGNRLSNVLLFLKEEVGDPYASE